LGGEEFCILLPGSDAAEAAQITERLRDRISRIATAVGGGTPLQVTISIGVAALGSSRRDLDELLAAADHALYQAKEGGRNRVCLLAASQG
jgi:diguanylate cyclase (GGDEF)-like protein